MKLKIPKKLQILNLTFDIKMSNDYYGYFDLRDPDNEGKPTIYIKKSLTKTNKLEILTHEALEVILHLLRLRYERPDEVGSFVFFYAHKDHDTASIIMSNVIAQILKYNGIEL